MSLDVGVNFRATAGYVTDGAGETYCIGDVYPVTRGGLTFGWETNAASTVDRDSTNDPRFAGINYASAASRTFRADLPATGDYDIHVAVGDTTGSQWVAWLFKDDATQFAETTSFTSGVERFKDATDVERTEAGWAANEVKVTRTFASTILRVVSNNDAQNVVIAHLRIVQVATADAVPVCWAQYRRRLGG